MRAASIFRTVLREQLRSLWDLVIVVSLAPLFIWMYWSFTGGGSTSYSVAVVDMDRGAILPDGALVNRAEEAFARLKSLSYEGGAPLLSVRKVADQAAGEALLRDRKAAALLLFPPDFSASLSAGLPLGAAELTLVGDLNNPYYTPAAVFASSVIDSYVREVAGLQSPIRIVERALGGSASRTEFEVYVPGLLIAAGTLMLFSVAIALSRMIESGTVRRLTLTRMTALDLLCGMSAMYLLVSLAAVALSFAVAVALGFRSEGPLWVAVLICAVTGFSVIGVGLLTACFCRSTTRAAIVVNFPLLLLLFFSGAVFPIGNPQLFGVANRSIGLFDILPQTHATAALNKVLSLGMGIRDVAYELAALVVLSIFYFAAGVGVFRMRHLRAA